MISKKKNYDSHKSRKFFILFKKMLKNQGLNINELNFIPHTFKVNDLIDGKADFNVIYDK